MPVTAVSICNLALARLGDATIESLDDATAQAEYCNLFYAQTRDEVLRSHPWNFAIARKALALEWKALSGVALANNGSGLIRVTYNAHGLETGDRVFLQGVLGVDGANASWTVTRINDNAFDLQGSTFSGSHTSGTGSWLKVPAFGWNYRYTLPADHLRILQLNGFLDTQIPAHWETEGGELLTNEGEAKIRYVQRVENPELFDPLFIDALTAKLAAKLAKPLTGSSSLAEGALTEYARLTAPLARRVDASEGETEVKPAWVESALVRARFGSEIG